MNVDGSRRALRYGDSIILGSIGAVLRRPNRLEVTACEPPPGDPLLLESPQPDIILFDSDGTRAEAPSPCLESQPSMLLIGVNPDVNLVKVWSDRQLRETSLVDLIEIITGETRESE